MTTTEELLYDISTKSVPIIDQDPKSGRFMELDLSVDSEELKAYDVTDPAQCQAYIDQMLNKKGAELAYGGYLERRNLYDNSPNFRTNKEENRNIHLGLDIWAPAGTAVLVPLDAIVHSYADNQGPGNYGPTIILEHNTERLRFFTLYGHLSRQSLAGIGQKKGLMRGEFLAELGAPEENGHYAPHLHFQIILDLEGYKGDYPGVCSESTLEHFKKNCPNPNLLLKI